MSDAAYYLEQSKLYKSQGKPRLAALMEAWAKQIQTQGPDKEPVKKPKRRKS